MTEEEWLACEDTLTLIRWVLPRAHSRKCQLYLCAGCRQISHLFYDPRTPENISTAERFADGLADKAELDRASWLAESATFGYCFNADFWERYPHLDRADGIRRMVEKGALPESVQFGGEWRVNEEVRDRLLAAARLVEFSTYVSSHEWSDWTFEPFRQVDWPSRWLIDCVFGNPFRPVAADPRWLTATVRDLAAAIYAERAFDRLPILADALEMTAVTSRTCSTAAAPTAPTSAAAGSWT